MHRVDPADFFGQHTLEESLVHRFAFSAARGEVDFVFSYAAGVLDVAGQMALLLPDTEVTEANRPHGDFRRLVFRGVSDFQPGQMRPSRRKMVFHPTPPFSADYALDTVRRGIAVAGVTVKTYPTGYEAEVVFHGSGAFHFGFAELWADQKLGRWLRAGPRAGQYVDVVTGLAFDPEHPFPDTPPE